MFPLATYYTFPKSLSFQSHCQNPWFSKRDAWKKKKRMGLTSPAPRNKNLCSAKEPPIKFKAATTPARTTAAVPCNKMTKFSQSQAEKVKNKSLQVDA